jgi:glycosyltransferase involved in cell wall biosynthesis
MRKILIIHNKYRNTGGEDIAVENEINFLQRHFKVKTLLYENNIKSIFDILDFVTLSNKRINEDIFIHLNEFKPDLVYINNVWFKISIEIFKKLKDEKISTLIKIHNFRYHCTRTFSAKKHLNNSDFCLACGFQTKKFGYFNNYFKDSLVKSLYAIYFGINYIKIIKDSFFNIAVLTNFHKNFLKEVHKRSMNVFVLPNPIDIEVKNIEMSQEYFVYAGRISREKGVGDLIEAFLSSNYNTHTLKIIGDGPDLQKLKKTYNSTNIEFLGFLENKKTLMIIKKSQGVFSATKLYEGQPTLLCEAVVNEIPVIFPNSGGISEFLPKNYDFTFEQFDYRSLVQKINLLNDKKLVAKNVKDARVYLNNKLKEEAIINIFKKILE